MSETTDVVAKVAALSAGNIHYREMGAGEPIVFVHGFAANGRLWDDVAADLSDSYRCILPDWPLGSHPEAMRADADLTAPAIAALISEFLASLDLEGVTVIGNDSGGAVTQILITEHPDRIGRVVLTNCDAFDKFPPGHFKLMSRTMRIPGAGALLAQSMRIGAVRRSPIAYGALAEHPLPEDVLRAWTDPMITDKGIRRDGVRFFASADAADTNRAAGKLPELSIPGLLVWGSADRFFTIGDAHRLAELIPDSTLVEIPGGKTFVPIDRPTEVAKAIAEFMVAKPLVAATG